MTNPWGDDLLPFIGDEPAPVRVLVIGDRGVSSEFAAAFAYRLADAGVVVLDEAVAAMRQLSVQLNTLPLAVADFDKALHDEATRCRIVTTPYRYVPPARLKQKAQWKQERSRVRRR